MTAKQQQKVRIIAEKKLAKQTTNYAGNPTGKLCTYCGERKEYSLFPMHKNGGKREPICFECLPKIQAKRIEWGQIALQPVNGERYHKSVSRTPKIATKKRQKSFKRADCDYGSGVSMRGVA